MEDKKITIGAALIVGPNRLEQLRRVLPQLVKFDQVVVINTSGQGAVNNYVRKLGKQFECHNLAWRQTPYTGTTGDMVGLNEWGFAYARNESFKYLKTSHALWLDTDDLIGRKAGDKIIPLDPTAAATIFRKLAEDPVDLWYVPYVYSRDEQGNPNVIHSRERFGNMARGWKWVYPIHECMVPETRMPPTYKATGDLVIIHFPETEAGENAERNMKMLQDWLEQLKRMDPAHVHHEIGRCRAQIGDTLWGLSRFAECVRWIEDEFLANHPDAQEIQKMMSCGYASRSYLQLRNYPGAKRMALKMLELSPSLPDGYLHLAAAKLANEEDAVDILRLLDEVGRSQEHPPAYNRNPLDYTFEPLRMKAQALSQVGKYEEALQASLQALQLKPTDAVSEDLRQKSALKVRQMNAAEAAHVLFRFLSEFGEHEKAVQLFDVLPYVAQQVPQVRDAAYKAVMRGEHLVKNDLFRALHESEAATPEQLAEMVRPEMLAYVLKRLQQAPGKKVLVVGCDQGAYPIELARAGYDVTALDINPGVITAMRTLRDTGENPLAADAKLELIHGWFELIEPEEYGWSNAFDAVVSIDQLEMVKNVTFSLGAYGDVVKDGAPVIVTTSNGNWDQGDVTPAVRDSRKPYVVRAFTQDSLEALLLSGQLWHVTECHDLPAEQPSRENQGWIVAEMRRQDRPEGKIVRIACGEQVEPFSPDSLEKGGIGGSETAVIRIADEMQKLGCRVVVYGTKVGIYEGVLYRAWRDYSPSHRSDLFISWRIPQLFEEGFPAANGRPNADVTVLWAHDLHYGPITEEVAARIDKVLVLSQFHKEHWLKAHPQYREDQIFVTRNGIDPERFAGEIERKPFNYFYSSSWDRGLEELMEVWPDIKAEIPEATLHVAYGVKTAELMYRSRGLEKEMEHLRLKQVELAEMDGVVVHGRMNQRELAELQMSCEAWLYPANPFEETYCITAVEAQAAGAVPFSRRNGALAETVNAGLVWDETTTREGVVKFLKHLPNWVSETEMAEAREWALQQTWSSLAREWKTEFIKD